MATGISKLSWLGVATEATPGTPIATPTMLAPTKAGFKNQKKIVYEDDDRGDRDAIYGARITTKRAAGTLKGNWYNNSGGYFLYAFMGADTPSQPDNVGSPTVWSHALTLSDAVPTLTLFRTVADVATYQMAYSCIEKLSFKWTADGKLVELDGSWCSQKGTKLGAVSTRIAPNDPVAFGGFAPTISVSSVSSTDITEMQIDLEQQFDLVYTSGNGQSYVAAYPGERKASLSFTARFINSANLYDHYDTDLQDSVVVTLLGDLIHATYNHSLIMNFPIVSWDEMEHDTSKNPAQIKAKGTVMAGTAKNSLFSATLQNTISTYTL